MQNTALKTLYCVFIICVVSHYVYSKDFEKDTILTKEIIVTSSRVPTLYNQTGRKIEIIGKEQIKSMPIQTVTDILKLSSNLDVRRRGASGSQADIGIRGGTFDQTLILINGIKMNDPQTGHHNLNLPIDPSSISKVEILGGGASRVFGPNAFSGAINFITQSENANNARIFIDGGSNSYYKMGISANNSFYDINNQISFNKEVSDGYINNTDFKFFNFYDLATINTEIGRFNIDFGYNKKAYGANSFYSAKYPNQYEKTATLFSSIRYKTGAEFQFSQVFSYRQHRDEFQLFRNNPDSWYKSHNYHMTDVLSAESKVNKIYEAGSTSIGAEYRYEHIYSNVLGDFMPSIKEVPWATGNYFTKSSERNSFNVFVEQNLIFDNLRVSGGLLYNYTDKFSTNLYPGIDIAYLILENTTLFASYNKSLRFPTFTDLYYKSNTNIGNINLNPEKADNYEIGVKSDYTSIISFNISAFYRKGTNMIDWIKKPGEEVWNAMNLTDVNSYGIEMTYGFNTKEILSTELFSYLALSYSVMDMNSKSSEADFISAYVLDYMKHKLNISLISVLPFEIKANLQFSLEDRAGSYFVYPSNSKVKFAPNAFLDIKLSKEIAGMNFFINAKNLTDTEYYDVSNVPQPSREFYFGISYNIDY